MRGQVIAAAVLPVLEDVGQGDDVNVGSGVQRVVGGAGAAAAAADQADLDGVVAAAAAPAATVVILRKSRREAPASGFRGFVM
jgi:hypothetical protein